MAHDPHLEAGGAERPLGSLRRFITSDDRAYSVARFLVTLDIVFVIIHGVKYAIKQDFIDFFGYWIYRNLTITNDWAIPEITNYLKFVVIVVLLVRVFGALRQPVYLAWAFVYAVALVDDSMQVHEDLGGLISTWLGDGSRFGLALSADEGFRAQDLGELVVYAVYAGTFGVVLSLGFLLSEAVHRWIGLGFGVLLVSLGFFVGFVDMVDRIVKSHSVTLSKLLATLEDGGEMVVISLTVGYALIVFGRYGPGSLDRLEAR